MSNLNLSLKISANADAAVKELDTVRRQLEALTATKPAAGASAEVIASYKADVAAAKAAVATKSALARDASKAAVAVARDAAIETARIEIAAAREVAKTQAALAAVSAKTAAATARATVVAAAKVGPSTAAGAGAGLSATAAAANRTATANTALAATNLHVAGTLGTAANGAGAASSSYRLLAGSLGGLKAAYGFAAAAAARFLSGSVVASSELESSFRSLQTLANNTGVSFKGAWDIVEKTAASGVVTRKEAADQMRALIAAGFSDIQQMEQLVQTANKLALAFPKNGSTPGVAVKDAFDGFRQGQSEKTDNFGMTDNLDDIYKKYGKTIGKTADALNQLEKNQAFANAVIEFGKMNLAGATDKTNQYEVATAKLSAAWGDFKITIGSGVAPLLTSIASGMTSLVESMRPTGTLLGIASEGFRLLLDSGKAFLGLFTGDSWAAVNEKIGSVAQAVAKNTATALSGTTLGGWLGIPDNMKDGSGPTAGTSLTDNPNGPVAAANAKKVQATLDESDAKANAKKLDQLKAFAEATESAALEALKSGNEAQSAQIAKNLEARKITAVDAARQTGKLEAEVLVQNQKNLAAQSARLQDAKKANTKADGSAFDPDLAAKLQAEESTIIGKRISAGNELKRARIDNEREVSSAQKQLAQEAAAKLTTTFQAQLESEQTAFEADLALKKAKFDNSLEERLTSQRAYIEQQKQLGLESVAQEEEQNRAKLENTRALLKLATNPQERAQAEAEITRLNASIATSTTKRAVTEVEALTKVLQLEEGIKAARSGLLQKGLEIKGDLLKGELSSIDESVRQFERQFAGEADLINERRAIANDERQVARFNEQKRLLDDKVQAESLAEQKISRLVENGQMSQLDGDRAMTKARLDAGAAIEANAVALGKLSEMYPDNLQLKSVADSAREAADALSGNLDKLATEFNRGIADTIGSRIEGWTKGIESFGDAVRNVFADVFGSVAKKFLNAFTDDLFVALNPKGGQGAGGFLSGLFNKGGSSGGGAASGGMLSSAWDWAASLFDEGGYTGHGGKFDPAGIVHKGEFVFNKEAVSAIGIQRLYAAMHNKRLPGYSDGGAVGGFANQAFNPSVNNNIHLAPNLLLDLDDLAARLGRHPQFERDVIKVNVSNPGKLGR